MSSVISSVDRWLLADVFFSFFGPTAAGPPAAFALCCCRFPWPPLVDLELALNCSAERVAPLVLDGRDRSIAGDRAHLHDA